MKQSNGRRITETSLRSRRDTNKTLPVWAFVQSLRCPAHTTMIKTTLIVYKGHIHNSNLRKLPNSLCSSPRFDREQVHHKLTHHDDEVHRSWTRL